MLAAFYDPYLDTLGGGERYLLSFALVLQKLGYEIDLFWDDTSIRDKLENRFGKDISKINILPNIFFTRNFMGTGNFLRSYDIVFIISDGSIPLMTGKNNILHFQVPFNNVNGKGLLNQIKLKSIKNVVCNSVFTKGFIDKEFNINSHVIYPPIDTKNFIPGKKENVILSVGRFSQLLQSKRQDILIESFKKACAKKLKGWRLILTGGSEIGGIETLNKLKNDVTNYPIEIIENPSFETLKKLYSKAKVFWNASGFDIDEALHPEQVEHFGITVVEAMSAGCLPLVHPKGGIKEIIQNEHNFEWITTEELVNKTIKFSHNINKELISKAIIMSEKFSEEKFHQSILKIIS